MYKVLINLFLLNVKVSNRKIYLLRTKQIFKIVKLDTKILMSRKRARNILLKNINSKSQWDRTFYPKKNTLIHKAAGLEICSGAQVRFSIKIYFKILL